MEIEKIIKLYNIKKILGGLFSLFLSLCFYFISFIFFGVVVYNILNIFDCSINIEFISMIILLIISIEAFIRKRDYYKPSSFNDSPFFSSGRARSSIEYDINRAKTTAYIYTAIIQSAPFQLLKSIYSFKEMLFLSREEIQETESILDKLKMEKKWKKHNEITDDVLLLYKLNKLDIIWHRFRDVLEIRINRKLE